MRLLEAIIAIIVSCALGALMLIPRGAAAQVSLEELCTVLRDQERVELEDLEVAVQVHREEALLAEDLFEMADRLWNADLLGTAELLGAEYDRDAAHVVLELAQREVDRQQAVLDQYQLVCSTPSTQEDPLALSTMEQARERYLAADCAVRELEVALGEIDLEYQDEALTRSRELLEHDIVTRRQALFPERDLNVARYRLDLARQRAARCQR